MESLIEKLVDNLVNEGTIENRCSEYGEDGYTLEDGKKAILFSNWNEFDKYPNVMERLEELYELEWSDEWIIDYNTDKAYRTQPDSYSWEQQFRITEDGELITPDNEVSEWIDHCKMDYDSLEQQAKCLPSFIEIEDIVAEGFEVIDTDNENGWYGRVDNPNHIAEDLLNDGYTDVVFSLNSVGQFSVNFTTLAKK